MVATPASSGFRYDINGLRAIAVVIVVLFHFKVPGFSGGFAGVDVFFVLSGFLMTSIMVKRLEARDSGTVGTGQGAGRILWQFYVARARRIIPALLVLVIVLLVAGWWTLPHTDYQSLGKHGASALAFLSNIVFWREAGYFDGESEFKWLLHTWSLSVEWQFYLLYPLVLLGLWRLKPGRPTILAAVLLGIGTSLLISVWMTKHSPSAAFFLLPARGWELLAGGLVFLTAERIRLTPLFTRGMVVAGLGCIALATTLFDAASHWPGSNALLPVAGTVMVLLATTGASWARNAVVQWLGLSSYSIYLWHWPVVVALVYLELGSSVPAIIAGLALSLLLGGLSYHFVEKRLSAWLSRSDLIRAPASIALGTVVIAMPALAIHQQEGFADRLPPAVALAAAEQSNINQRRAECHHEEGLEFPWCTYGGSDIRAIVIGDSHAASVVTAVQAALGGSDSDPHSPGVLYSSHSSCPTLFGVKRDMEGWNCAAFNEFVAEKIAALPGSLPLIIVNTGSYSRPPYPGEIRSPIYFSDENVGYTEGFLEDFRQALVQSSCQLARHRPVYLTRPVPDMKENVPRVMARRILLGKDEDVRISRAHYEQLYATHLEAQDDAVAACDNVSILETRDYLCDDNHCYSSKEGRPLYYDSHHLSEFGNRQLVPMFRRAVGFGADQAGNAVLP